MKYTLKIALLLCTLVLQTASLYSALAGVGAKEPIPAETKNFLAAYKEDNWRQVEDIMRRFPSVVNQIPDNPNKVFENGYTVLLQAAYSGDSKQIKTLLLRGADSAAGKKERTEFNRRLISDQNCQSLEGMDEVFLESSFFNPAGKTCLIHMQREYQVEKIINTATQELNNEREKLVDSSLLIWPAEIAQLVAGYAATLPYSETVIEKE